MRYHRIALVVSLIVAVLAAEWVWLKTQDEGPSGDSAPAATPQAVVPGGGFTLVDHEGKPASDEVFVGRHLLMLFGYTLCPDVCPTSLGSIAAALELLGESGEAVQPLFVTLDPERDTPEVLADYVTAFHPRLIGLTGSPEQIRKVAHDYRVYYARADTGDGDYLVDHSAYIYLIGPDGRTLTYLKHDASPETLAETVGEYLARPTTVSDAPKPSATAPGG